MTALIEIIIEGVKKVSSEIVVAILLLIAFAIFPSLRKLFRKKNEAHDEEAKHQLEQLQSVVTQTLQQTQKQDDSEDGLRKQLEILKQEEQQLTRLKETLKRHDSALQNIQAQTEEEQKQRADLHRQIEEQRREEQRLKAEIQRKQEELRQEQAQKAEARKAEKARQKARDTLKHNTGWERCTIAVIRLPHDWKKALKWYLTAAEQGYYRAKGALKKMGY